MQFSAFYRAKSENPDFPKSEFFQGWEGKFKFLKAFNSPFNHPFIGPCGVPSPLTSIIS
jgi:hypothetical protein